MDWESLLSEDNETITVPWTGGRKVYSNGRTFKIQGDLPNEFGWYSFNVISPRKVSLSEKAEPPMCWEEDYKTKVGYLIGDRFISDDSNYQVEPGNIFRYGERVFLIDPNMLPFSRVMIASFENKQNIFVRVEFPLGPEPFVLQALEDNRESLKHIPNVIPSLDLSFRHEVHRKKEAEKRRLEIEKARLEEDRRRQEEARRAALLSRIGTGDGRRALAAVDFAGACRACLGPSGAEYLSHRHMDRNETAVRYRFRGHRLECVVNTQTLRIIDSGICLSAGGVRGDTRFTLESLPGVVNEAVDRGVLHIYRYA